MPKLLLNQRKISQEFARLTKRDANDALYSSINAHGAKVDISGEAKHSLPPGYRLLRVDGRQAAESHGEIFEIALLNDLTKQIVYYNQVVITEIVDLNCRPASQMLVWRSTDQQHSSVLRDLASNVFFNYVLERYDVILSDNTHTSDGQFFWKRQMSSALARNLFVYFYRMLEAKLERIPDQAALDDLDDTLWGDDDPYSYHLAIISKVELPAEITVESLVAPSETTVST